MSGWTEHALTTLRDAGHRDGGARRAILELLGRQGCCLTAQEIHDALRADGRPVGIASVYRVLDLLTELRLVQRVELGGGLARYEMAQPSGDHHHHLVCTDCGKIEAFDDERLEAAVEKVADRVGYALAAHDVVLHGACADCRA